MRLLDIKATEKKIKDIFYRLEVTRIENDPQAERIVAIEDNLQNIMNQLVELRVAQGNGSGRLVAKLREEFSRNLPEVQSEDIKYFIEQENELLIIISSGFLGFNVIDNSLRGLTSNPQDSDRWKELFDRKDYHNSDFCNHFFKQIHELIPKSGVTLFNYSNYLTVPALRIKISFPKTFLAQNKLETFWVDVAAILSSMVREVQDMQGRR